MIFNFIDKFNNKIADRKNNWNVSGLITPTGTIYSLGTDSKLIGRIFELITYDILREIAEENDYILQPSTRQTVYPDFTLMKNLDDKEKIAIDIKTTYRSFKRNGSPSAYSFTLGSYASFMRNGTKNIMYPYSDYIRHYIVGFIYTRNENASEGKIYELSELNQIQVPYKDVRVFVQEKYKIAGDKPGSGNTENIGSFRTNNIAFLVRGEGPFSILGEKIFENYWANYPKYRELKKDYENLDQYLEKCKKAGMDVADLIKKYKYWKKFHNGGEDQ